MVDEYRDGCSDVLAGGLEREWRVDVDDRISAMY